MLLTLVAAVWSIAAVAPVESLRVPYVPQTDALCGGAAAAMVSATGATRTRTSPSSVHSSNGVPVGSRHRRRRSDTRRRRSRLARPGRRRCRSRRFATASKGRPVIVLLADRRDLYHYVVVVGADAGAIIVHDPSWGPSRAVKLAIFESSWRPRGIGRWLLFHPQCGAAHRVPFASATKCLGVPATGACDVMLDQPSGRSALEALIRPTSC
jgi:hypothetical protein